MRIEKLPELDKIKKEDNPLEHFYRCLNLPKGTSVTNVLVNKDDSKKLEKLFGKWVRHKHKDYSENKIQSVIALNWCNMGPNDSKEIPSGEVHIRD